MQGHPRKSEYRRFNIRTITHEGSDDYQSMREALTRRFNRWKDTVETEAINAPDGQDRNETWRLLPDLLLIDGGKGQLNVAVEVLEGFGLRERIPVASLAKQFEEIYLPEQSAPIILPRTSQALYLVQRVRDEAHRFAIASHRRRRNRMGLASKLETIPGIGPKRRKALLQHFEFSIERIKNATVEELCAVNGINETIAETILEELRG